ncbi:MAG TPA: tetratricopeptide repeat protein [Candidatus Angelobacter sp.]|nr:tetratricopeptide repeat protein [Candidatus Angelobacter sp.]
MVCCLPVFCLAISAQTDPTPAARQLFEQERWPELVQLLQQGPRNSADLNYYYGVALAHLERWQEASKALSDGQRLASNDKRFPIELAGVAFKQKNYGKATRDLHRALELDPKDPYANEFLATIYFLEGNLEAALKYWNRLGKPEIVDVRIESALRVRPVLLDHAFAFSPASTLTLEELLASNVRLRGLEIFPTYNIKLEARPDGKFDAIFRAQELNGFGNTKLQALVRTFSGILFEEITPEYYNLRGSATNIVSLLRFDTDKRRALVNVSGPLGGNPQWRYRVGADLRNENWTIQTSFTGPSTVLGATNLRRESVSAEISNFAGARWTWGTGLEVSHRDFRNVIPGIALTPELLAHGYQLKQKAQFTYELWRSPEKRLTIASSANSQAGRIWSQPAQSFEKLQGTISMHWLPRDRGDDYEMQWRLHAGKTFGQIPFDELFMLGVDRDNDLPLRAHLGTRHGQKGSAPLGRSYFLSNWEIDKHVYSNGILTMKLGPFLDSGKILDSSSTLGPHKWLFDTGPQAKLRVLGVGVVLLYGKDLRTGNNAFYANIAW